LVLTGAGRPGSDFFGEAADVIAASIPHASRQRLAGQSHVADPNVIAAVLVPFLTADSRR
jgi:hypothetical protein